MILYEHNLQNVLKAARFLAVVFSFGTIMDRNRGYTGKKLLPFTQNGMPMINECIDFGAYSSGIFYMVVTHYAIE